MIIFHSARLHNNCFLWYDGKKQEAFALDILAEIKTQYETFGKARRQISDIILENPAKCCFLSLKEFAAAANTTEVTVLKYCRDLGISSFVELKKSLQSYMLTWISPTDRTKFIASQSVTQNDLIEKVLQSELEAIKRTFDENSIDRMMEFVSCLRQAKHICIAAHNVSKIPAQYFICRMAAAGLVANQLNLDDKFQIFSGLTSCCPEDTVLVAFCFSPYGKNTIQTAKFCKAAGIRVLALTDLLSSPMMTIADIALVCSMTLMEVTNSMTSMIAVVNVLSMLYSFEGQSEAAQWREKLEKEFEGYFPELP